MVSPEEEKAAQRQLDEAVETYLRVRGWDNGMVLTGWVLIAHQHGFKENGDDFSGHPIIYMGGSLPDHVAIGLMYVGIDTVRGTGRWALSEED